MIILTRSDNNFIDAGDAISYAWSGYDEIEMVEEYLHFKYAPPVSEG